LNEYCRRVAIRAYYGYLIKVTASESEIDADPVRVEEREDNEVVDETAVKATN